MKTLLINPPSKNSFWSFPEACRITGKKSVAIPLGLITVAAMLPASWPIRLVDLAVEKISDDDWQWADVAMITGMLVHRPHVRNIIKTAKRHGKTVVVGGPYATAVPEEVLDTGADIVLRGEAENQILDLLDALEKNASGVIIESPERPHLATSPIPRFDLLDRCAYLNPMVQTSRGCPFACEFCDVTHHFGRRLRHKKPSQVIAELETLRDLGWRGHLFVADDNFIGNRDRANSLLKALTEWHNRCGKPFSFATQASIDLGADHELIDRMTEANFGEIFIGIESPDEAALQKAHKFQNLKNSPAKSIETINRNGLMVLGSFIIGMDNEKKGVGDRIRTLVQQTNMPFAMINLMGAPPGTLFWKRLQQEGRLSETLDCYREAADLRMNFKPTRPIEDIRREYADLWENLYSRERYLQRCFNYFMTMRPTRKALARKTGKIPGKVVRLPDPRTAGEKIQDILTAIRVVFNDGVVQATRRQYWRQMILMIRHNPSRLVWYIATIVRIDDMIKIKNRILAAAASWKALSDDS